VLAVVAVIATAAFSGLVVGRLLVGAAFPGPTW
jgi:hypothetical protein